MSSESVNIRIGTLTLELPFRNQAHGRALADQITRELGRLLALRAPRGSARLGRLRVDLPRLPPHASDALIARLVAASVQRALDQEVPAARREDQGDGDGETAPSPPAIELIDATAGESARARARKGSPLPAATQSFMEERLGHAFDDVRIHTDNAAAALAEGRGDHAVTIDDDVFFGAGRYRPDTLEGRELLAHELTHVAQHDGAGPPAATGALEAEAGAAAAAVAAGRQAAIRHAAAPGTPLGSPGADEDRPEHDRTSRPHQPAAKFRENPRKIIAILRTFRLTPRVNQLIDQMRRGSRQYETKIVVSGITFSVVAQIAGLQSSTESARQDGPSHVTINVNLSPLSSVNTDEEAQRFIAQKLLHELDHAAHRIEEWLADKGIRQAAPSQERQDLTRWKQLVDSKDVNKERNDLTSALFAFGAKIGHTQLDQNEVHHALYWMAEEHAVSKSAAKISGETSGDGRPVDNGLIAEKYVVPLFDRAGGAVSFEDKGNLKPLIALLKAFLDALDRAAGSQTTGAPPTRPTPKP